MPKSCTASTSRSHLTIIDRRAAQLAAEERAHVERIRQDVAPASRFFPAVCVDVTLALGDCPDLHRPERLEALRDRLTLAVLADALEAGLVAPDVYVAAAGVLAARARIAELGDRRSSSSLALAAQMTALVEAADLPRDVERFVESIGAIELDPVGHGIDLIAARIVHAVAHLDPALVSCVAVHAAATFGGPTALDALDRRHTARCERDAAQGVA